MVTPSCDKVGIPNLLSIAICVLGAKSVFDSPGQNVNAILERTTCLAMECNAFYHRNVPFLNTRYPQRGYL